MTARSEDAAPGADVWLLADAGGVDDGVLLAVCEALLDDGDDAAAPAAPRRDRASGDA